jgi:hypothetical protein
MTCVTQPHPGIEYVVQSALVLQLTSSEAMEHADVLLKHPASELGGGVLASSIPVGGSQLVGQHSPGGVYGAPRTHVNAGHPCVHSGAPPPVLVTSEPPMPGLSPPAPWPCAPKPDAAPLVTLCSTAARPPHAVIKSQVAIVSGAARLGSFTTYEA